MSNARTVDPYQSLFDSRAYLRQYYSDPQLCSDDVELLQILNSWLRRQKPRFGRALDLGCGPTLHYSFTLAPFVDAIDLADYLPGNLAEIRLWLDEAEEAHDWDPRLQGVLTCGGGDITTLAARKSLYRTRVSRLLPCDLRKEDPLGHPARYPLVTSFFCAECVATSRSEWKLMLSRMANLVEPGGSLFMTALHDASRYNVLGTWFSSVPVTPDDFAIELPKLGFPKARLETHLFPSPAWSEDGFDHICVIGATRE